MAHFTEYAVLALLSYFAWLIGIQHPRSRALLLASVCSILYAITDEIHQSFVTGREALPTDVFIDSLGVLAAVWLIRKLHADPIQAE